MIVYLHGDGSQPPERHYIIVAPAAHMRGQECPTAWVDDENKPVQFEVLFTHGKAEVDDEMGNYLVKIGQAQKTRLHIPNAW